MICCILILTSKILNNNFLIILEDTNLIIFYGENLIGLIVCNGKSLLLQGYLKKIVVEIESCMGEFEEGIVTDSEIQVAKNVLDGYNWLLRG